MNIELGNSDDIQLFNLSDDIGQKVNLAESHPEKLEEMISLFKEIRGEGFQEVEQLELK